MGHYLSNVRDLEFNLFEVFGIQDRVDETTMRDLIGELDRLATGPLAESFADTDRVPLMFDPVAGTVTVPESLKKAYRLLRDGGWHRLLLPTELGGAGLPLAVRWAATELLVGANPALYLYFSAGPRCAAMLHELGTPQQRHWARLMVERDWGATMAMTEPDAGSDVGAARATATRQPDGSWHLHGVKRFITSGDQDLTENILHLVLARPVAPGLSPAPGAKGLSVFLVPKYLFDPHTGEPRDRNGVYATNLEHKMGLRGSATCELTFGASTPARGWLLGERHDGIAQMFHAIEWARMTVGAKAIATLSTGHRNALAYARTRVQGPDLRRLLDKTAPRVAIIDHPDVRRMLMMQKAYAEGLRALLLHTANVRDEFDAGSENGGESRRAAFDAVRDVLVPIVKGVSADRAYEQLGSALQVLGGSGYLQDYPIEQYLRDSKIDSLYEGTTAIQSFDFFFRQIVRDNGRVWTAILNGLRPPVHEPRLAAEHRLLDHAVTDMRAIVAAMNRFLTAIDVHPDSIYRVGQNTVRLLHAAGDLFVAGFLLRQAILAFAALDRRPPPRDRAFYEGKVAVASYFARTVLPGLAATREVVETTDNTLMAIGPEAF